MKAAASRRLPGSGSWPRRVCSRELASARAREAETRIVSLLDQHNRDQREGNQNLNGQKQPIIMLKLICLVVSRA